MTIPPTDHLPPRLTFSSAAVTLWAFSYSLPSFSFPFLFFEEAPHIFLGLRMKLVFAQGCQNCLSLWTHKDILENMSVPRRRTNPFWHVWFCQMETQGREGRESVLLPQSHSLCPLSQMWRSLATPLFHVSHWEGGMWSAVGWVRATRVMASHWKSMCCHPEHPMSLF